MPHPNSAEHNAKYRAVNADKVRAANALWRESNRDKIVGYHLKERYGITVEQYEAMLTEAGYACQICSTAVLHMREPGCRTAKACVDHCHTTGKVRGILCNHCNKQLSFFEKHAVNAANYLQRNAA